MKTKLFFFLSFLILSVGTMYAAYVPLTITAGFTADVIANGVGTASGTTSTTVDGANYVFVSNGWQQTATSTPCTTGLPVTGLINSAVTTGLNFQLANYTGNNSLRISTNNVASTLTFQTAYSAQTLYFLAVTGSGTSTVTAQINFTDGTNQIQTGIVVADWYGGANAAITGFQRLHYTNNTLDNNANGPRIYQYSIAINAANQAKLISSLQITRTASTSTTPTLNVLAVSIDQIAVTCPPPTSPTATSITPTSAILNWTNTGTPLNYQIKYGPAGFPVATGGTSIFTSTKPYTLNPPLTPSTSYDYYVRIICTAGDTSAWSPVTNFTTLCNAPAILSKKDSFHCGPGTVHLQATTTAGAVLRWFSTSAGGTSLGAGGLFTTPSITTTTNYYVEAANLTAAGNMGRNDYTGIASAAPNGTGQGIRFNALADINLDSVAIWVTNDTGKVVVQLQNSTNVVLRTDTFNFSGTGATSTSRVKVYLKVNYGIAAGNDYKILAMPGTTVPLSREQAINPTFGNYTIANAITQVSSWVNGATNAANYYYFYNFYVSKGCASPRQAVVATIRPIPTVNIGNDTTICPGVSYTFNAGNAGGTYLWSPGGQTTQTITTNAVGQYVVKVTVNGCSKNDTIVITLGTTPVNNLVDTTNLCEGSETTLNAGNTGSTFVWTPGGATTQTITVNSGGTQSVDIKSIDGCKITSNTYVKMRPLPINNLGNDTSICESVILLLDAGNAGYNYAWNTGATTQTIDAADSGTYKVTVTTPYSCVSSDSIHIAFKREPRTEGFNFIPKFFEELGKVDFSPLNPTDVLTYEWDFGDGTPLVTAMNPAHVYGASGEYNVTLKVYNECTDFSLSQMINVDLPTGTATIDKDNVSLNIYPNPAKSVINIGCNMDCIMEDVMVFNALGSMVYHHKPDSKAMHQMSVEQLSSGIYFVRVLTDKGFVNRQIQIRK